MTVRTLRALGGTMVLLSSVGSGCSESHLAEVGDPCARESDCGAALTCAAGRCAEDPGPTCAGERCDAGMGVPCEGGTCEGPARSCTTSGECRAGEICEGGTCVASPFGVCSETCGPGERCLDGACVPEGTLEARDVDMLFVVDNSNSMREEQVLFATKFATFVQTVTSGDADGDGTVDFFPPESLHVGVVSSDMGSGAYDVGGVCYEGLGDDGILRDRPSGEVTGCDRTYPPFLSFEPAQDDPADLIRDFECIARLGTGGCGFEQQLEAGLKAVTPSTSAIRFFNGTTGHGDGANAGFLRPGSVLVVVILTDEEDCSVRDPELLNPDPMNPTYPGNINLRCFQYPEAVHPVERFVDGFLALRTDPDRLIFATIAGVPLDLAETPGEVDYDAVLSDPRMEERIDEDRRGRLEVACESALGEGGAFPARRLVSTAQQIDAAGAHAVVGSICGTDFLPALRAIATRLGEILGSE